MGFLKEGRWRAPGLLLLTLILFTWQYTAFNPTDRGSLRSGDIDSQYYSLARWMSVRVAQGELPLWNRDVFGGSPFLAEPQAAALYPPRWMTIGVGVLLNGTSGLPFWLFEIEIFAHLFLAALLTYGFLRSLALSRSAAVVGAVIFTYSGALVTYPLEQVSILEAVVWLPGVLWGIERGVTQGRRGWVLSAIALALSFLAGSTQITLYLGYAALAYALWRGFQQGRTWRSLSLPIGGWLGLTLLLVLAQAVPTIELTLRSPRATASFAAMRNGLGFPDLLELFLPHTTTVHAALYMGILPLAFALVAMVFYGRQATYLNGGEVTIPFWGWLAGVGLLFAFGGDSAFFGWLYQFLPGVALFRSQERVLFLVAFAIATLAAFGVESLLRKPIASNHSPFPIAKGMWIAAAALLMGTLYAYFISHPALSGWAFALLMTTFSAMWFSVPPSGMSRRWVGVALLIVMVDLFTIHGRTVWQPSLPEEHEERPGLVESLPLDPHTTLLDVENGVQPNIGAFLGVPAVSGASQLRLATYESLRESLPRSHWWALWGATHAATPNETLDVPATLLNDSTVNDELYYLHQLNAPTPRATLRYAYQVVPSEDAQLELLQAGTPDLLLETTPPFEGIAEGIGTVTRLAIGHESWEIDLTTSQPTLLRLSLPTYPGWQAFVNGQLTPILRADLLWSAVAVPAGTHTIILRFLPIGWLIAIVVSLGAWGVALFLAIGYKGVRQ
jgi:hypothetical protein